MKSFIFLMLMWAAVPVKAQQIDSIFVNLYTDSLKKNTYNYINVDGMLHNGKYLPLDTTQLSFSSSYGKFYGNNLWIENKDYPQPILITITLRKNPAVTKQVTLYIKRQEDGMLKTADELLNEMQGKKKQRKS